MLQSLAQLLLLSGRQTPEAGIILQFAFLFSGRQIFVAPQPVAGMALRCRASRRALPLDLRHPPRWRMLSLRWRVIRGSLSLDLGRTKTILRQTGDRRRQGYHQTGERQPSRPVLSPPHGPHPLFHFALLQILDLLLIRVHILLHIEIIQQLEIRIHVVILV